MDWCEIARPLSEFCLLLADKIDWSTRVRDELDHLYGCRNRAEKFKL